MSTICESADCRFRAQPTPVHCGEFQKRTVVGRWQIQMGRLTASENSSARCSSPRNMVWLWSALRGIIWNWFDLVKASFSIFAQVGEPLLSPSLGFPSLESLLRSLPDVCTLRYSAGQLVVMGVASSATAHVRDMVAKQNTARRGKKRGGVGGAFIGGRGGTGLPFDGGRGRRVSRGFGGGSWSGTQSYRPNWEGNFSTPQSPYVNAWREDSASWQQTWGPTHKNMVQKTNNVSPAPKTVQATKRRMPQRGVSASVAVSTPDVLQVTKGGAEVFGSRVVQILRGRVHGLYQMQVESQYKKGWGEELPDNWIVTLAGSDCGLVTEKVGAHLLCRVHEVKQVVDNGLSGGSVSRESRPHFPQQCLTLPPPKVHQICSDLLRPTEEDYYDVRVCFVPVGGITFMVQDFGRRCQYEQLEEEMAAFYNEMVNRRPLAEEELRGGSLVAVRQGRRWQRARVLPTCASSPLAVPKSPFSLLLVDNGRFVVRNTTEDLQWLWSRFGALEEGAAKARLAGLKPLDEGEVWGSEAENWLRRRLLGKDFVSLVAAREEDLMILKLVDTSGEPEDDLDVAEEMVAEGFALWEEI